MDQHVSFDTGWGGLAASEYSPGYDVHGLAANVGVTVCVYAASLLVGYGEA